MTRILVVDDEERFLSSISRILRLAGYSDQVLSSQPGAVPDLVSASDFDVALIDVFMPDLSGLELLDLIKERSPWTECIMVTADDDAPSIVRALKHGAYDYLVKPVVAARLVHTLERALDHGKLLRSFHLRFEPPSSPLQNPGAFGEIQTRSAPMQLLLREAEMHASSDIPVLITGETGVGKELLARAIHAASPRARSAFLPINMVAVSPSLFESEFFGHLRGAYTGAVGDRQGYLARADGGTILLDEIGDLALDVQGKLLRVLQDREFMPVGSDRPLHSNVRIIAATNQDLEQAVRAGRFRKDLYYRLQYARMQVPPLRQRPEDIPLLARSFLAESAHPDVTLSESALEALCEYSFPGNARELKGIIQSTANLVHSGAITRQHFRFPQLKKRRDTPAPGSVPSVGTLAEVEKRHILSVYEASGRNKTTAAKILGVGIKTLYRRLKEFGLD